MTAVDTIHGVTRADILEALTHARVSLYAARTAGRDTACIAARIDDLLEQLWLEHLWSDDRG